MKNRKILKYVIFGAIALTLGCLLLPYLANPFTVKDPNDPKFNPNDFRLANYPQHGTDPNYRAALQHVLPIGTPKSVVDEILIQKSGAISNMAEDGTVGYIKKGLDGVSAWVVEVDYDENNRLEGMDAR